MTPSSSPSRVSCDEEQVPTVEIQTRRAIIAPFRGALQRVNWQIGD
jgi:hypothetical protein